MSDAFWPSPERPMATDGVTLRETYWGFALTENAGQESLAEMLLKCIGVVVFPAVGALVSFSGLIGLPFGLLAKLGILIGFSLIGGALFAYACRGLRRVLQVDNAHGVFRLGTENTAGHFTERQKHAFKSVESIFLKRGSNGSATAKLHLRLKGVSEPVFILSGPESVLVPVLERIVESVRRLQGSRKARTKTTGRFVHVSFA